MKGLIFFLLGAFFVVVGEWLYLNFINRSAIRSFKPTSDDRSDTPAERTIESQTSDHAKPSTGTDSATTPVPSNRTVVQAVSKGRAFLDRMAIKEAGEANHTAAVTNDSAASSKQRKADKTSIAQSLAHSKQAIEIDSRASADAAVVVAEDDLEKISGIGPKIAALLASNGIGSFAALAEANSDTLKAVLTTAGPRYALADISSWSDQAKALQSAK